MYFKRLTEYWNEESGVYPTDAATVAKVVTFFAKSLSSAISDVLFRTKGDHYLRVSQMGKPLIVLCLNKIGYEDQDEPNFKMRWIFLLGHLFEAYLMCVVYLLGYDIHSAQDEIDFGGVLGHIDFMVDEVVVEAERL